MSALQPADVSRLRLLGSCRAWITGVHFEIMGFQIVVPLQESAQFPETPMSFSGHIPAPYYWGLGFGVQGLEFRV